MAPSIYLMAACAFLGMMAHLFGKIAKVNKISPEGVNLKEFFAKEWPYVGMSLCAIIISLIAQENVSRIHYAGVVAGEWMYLIFAIIGWASDSVIYTLLGRWEKKIIKDNQ